MMHYILLSLELIRYEEMKYLEDIKLEQINKYIRLSRVLVHSNLGKLVEKSFSINFLIICFPDIFVWQTSLSVIISNMKKTQNNKILDLVQLNSKKHILNSSHRAIFSSNSSKRKYVSSISSKNKQNSQNSQCPTDRTNNPLKSLRIQDFQTLILPKPTFHSQKHLLNQILPEFRLITSVRFRPFTINQIDSESCSSIQSLTIINDKTLKISDAPNNIYNFDRIFTPQSTDDDIYNQCGKQLVQNFIKGYNATIFAYGQTGSGKTYTMFDEDEHHKGIVPLAIQDMWKNVSRMKNLQYYKKCQVQANGNTLQQQKEDRNQIKVSCSMLQIYRQNLYDLLADQQKPHEILKIKQTSEGFQVKGLQVFDVQSYDQIMKIIQKGNQSKRIRQTELNQVSSRSHLILTVYLEVKISQSQFRRSKLNLIDLAGSQKVSKSKVQGQGLEQAKKINLSLSVLGNTINALARGQQHIPFRQSKLTKLLHESLGGNALTSVIVTCSMHQSCTEETISSLKFAHRAKRVKNNPSQNISHVSHKDKYVDKFVFQSLKHSFRNKQKLIHQIRNYIKQFQQDQLSDIAGVVTKIKNLIDFQTQSNHRRALSSIVDNFSCFENSNVPLSDAYKTVDLKLAGTYRSVKAFDSSNGLSNGTSQKPRQSVSFSKSKSGKNSKQNQSQKFACSIQDFDQKIRQQNSSVNKPIYQGSRIQQLEAIIQAQRSKLQSYQSVKQNYKVKITANKISDSKVSKSKFNTPQNLQKKQANSNSNKRISLLPQHMIKDSSVKELNENISKVIECLQRDKKQYYNFQRQVLLCQIDELIGKLFGKEKQFLTKTKLSQNFIDKYISLLQNNLNSALNFIKKKLIQKQAFKTPFPSPFGRSPAYYQKADQNYQQLISSFNEKLIDQKNQLEFYCLENEFLKQKNSFYQKFRKQAQKLVKQANNN